MVDDKEIIEIQRAGNARALNANGLDRATLIALIPSQASSRIVTFTTSAGSFLTTAKEKTFSTRATTVDKYSSDRLVAEAVLVAGTMPDTAYVIAKVGEGGFSESIYITFK